MFNYDKWIKKHLADYKVNRLGVFDDGLFDSRPYGHILPANLERLNTIETFRTEFWHEFATWNAIKLHRYFHHLNSSQAMGFNLFYPFLKHTELLLNVLNIHDETAADCAFEKVLNSVEQTNFDFYMRLNSGAQLLFELKLSEREFGTASADKGRPDKLENYYKARLSGKVDSAWLESDVFFKKYQLLRNIAYLNADTADLLFLIFPAKNSVLIRQSDAVLAGVDKSIRDKIKVIHLETLVDAIRQSVQGQDVLLQAHYALFQEKYIGIP